MQREALIAAKGEAQARLRRAQHELEAARASLTGARGLRRKFLERRVAALESDVDGLMAEEMRLRLEIDRAEH